MRYFSSENFRFSGDIIEGKVITEKEYKRHLTVIFYPKTGEVVENFYDATVE